MKHELKILPKYFDAVNCGKKNFEIRINDRDYQEHDELVLKEWYRGKYTGRECRRWVGYIYHGDGTYGIAENTVVMALTTIDPVRHGYWKETDDTMFRACSVCGYLEWSGLWNNYCPECGAKMDGGEE